MVSNRTLGLLRLITLINVIGASVLFAALFVLMDLSGQFGSELRDRYPWYLLAIIVSLMVGGGSQTLDPSRTFSLQLGRINVLRQTLWLTLSVTIGILLFLVVTKDQGAISRQFLFIYLLLLHPVLFLTQWFAPKYLAGFVFGKGRQDRALLIGYPVRPECFANWLALKRAVGIEAVGFLSTHDRATLENPYKQDDPGKLNLPCLGSLEDLERFICEGKVTQAIIADIFAVGTRVDALIKICEAAGVRVIIYCDFSQRLRRNLTQFLDDGLHFIATRAEPLESPFNRAVKRLFDLAFALVVVLVALAPLALVVFIMQRVQSTGPLFIQQVRSGLNNQQFKMLKFRTMHTNHDQETLQATSGDSRIYPFGRFLRRFSLDEIPQFINVLRGEMSVVGPRPHLPEHNRQFAEAYEAYNLRSWVKPGITGLAQVRGHRGPVCSPQDVRLRVESDIEYLENWQIFLDLDIVLLTVAQMLFPPSTAV